MANPKGNPQNAEPFKSPDGIPKPEKITTRVPEGTKERIKSTGKSEAEFVREAVEEKLKSEEK